MPDQAAALHSEAQPIVLNFDWSHGGVILAPRANLRCFSNYLGLRPRSGGGVCVLFAVDVDHHEGIA